MNNYTIIIAALLVVIGWFIYRYANEPEPLASRASSAIEALKKNQPAKALDELAPQTRAENFLNDAKEAVGITPTSTY